MPRESVGKVYKLIVDDLLFATQAGLLPVVKSTTYPGRITHYAAKALLGKVYLTMASYKKYSVTFEGLMSQAGKSDYGYRSSVSESSESLYQKAESTLNDVIGNGGYKLLDKYEDIFKIANKNLNTESIFEVQFSNNVTSDWTKDLGYPCWVPGLSDFCSWAGSTSNRAVPSLYLYYSNGDQRRDYNLPTNYIRRSASAYISLNERNLADGSDYMKIINGTGNFFAYMGFGKYRWGDTWNGTHTYPGGTQTPNNGIMMRYADVLLMYAEASLEVTGAATQKGLDAINLVRQRARGVTVNPSQTPDFPALTINNLTLDVIMDERARELCMEHYRKFDLLRTNRLQLAVKKRKPIADPNMTGPKDIPDFRWLYPIPQNEIDIVKDKTKLWQNPGY